MLLDFLLLSSYSLPWKEDNGSKCSLMLRFADATAEVPNSVLILMSFVLHCSLAHDFSHETGGNKKRRGARPKGGPAVLDRDFGRLVGHSVVLLSEPGNVTGHHTERGSGL